MTSSMVMMPTGTPSLTSYTCGQKQRSKGLVADERHWPQEPGPTVTAISVAYWYTVFHARRMHEPAAHGLFHVAQQCRQNANVPKCRVPFDPWQQRSQQRWGLPPWQQSGRAPALPNTRSWHGPCGCRAGRDGCGPCRGTCRGTCSRAQAGTTSASLLPYPCCRRPSFKQRERPLRARCTASECIGSPVSVPVVRLALVAIPPALGPQAV